MWPFKRKTYKKTITHKDWRDYDGIAGFLISRKEHKAGKSPTVEITSSSKTVYHQVKRDGSVMIFRGLPIWQGTLFSVTIEI